MNNVDVIKVKDGDVTLRRTVWETLRIPASGLNPPGPTNAPSRDEDDGTLLFAPSVENVVASTVGFPRSMCQTGMVMPHIHWAPTDGTDGNIVWQLDYTIVSVGVVPGPSFQFEIVASADGSEIHTISEFATLPIQANYNSGDLVNGKLSRQGADERDTYAGDARLLEFSIGFQIDSIGSKYFI